MASMDSAGRLGTILRWAARLVPAAILGMAVVPKLTGAPDAVTLFTTLGAEPWGRYLVGSAELLTVVLLLAGRTVRLGAALGLVLMTGAIGTHLLRLGVSYGGDPSLFIMAVTAFAGSAAAFWLHRAPRAGG
jgi:uncharacterized membrane protein YphA (DoxX/SURF4 family)